MAVVRLQAVTRHFAGASQPAVEDVQLDVADGEIVVVLGGGGSGKSTLLRLVAGLEQPDAGRVVIGDPEERAPADATVALVFQNYAVYPNLSVRDNIGLPLRTSKRSAAETEGLVDDVVRRMGLRHIAKQAAVKLSASERMRVVLARSLVRRPDVMLLDEPLANLEPSVRTEVRDQLRATIEAWDATALYATDDPVEAEALGARVVQMQAGRLLSA